MISQYQLTSYTKVKLEFYSERLFKEPFIRGNGANGGMNDDDCWNDGIRKIDEDGSLLF